MATFEERRNGTGNTVYRVKVRLRGYPPVSATFDRKTDARKWAQDTESAIRNGRYFSQHEAKRHTVNETIERYILDVLPSKKSARDQARQLRWWQAEIGSYTLADATPALISECRDQLSRGDADKRRSPSTVNRYMAALSHVFTIAVKEWQWLETNPFMRIRTLKEPRGRVRYLSDEERTVLLQACKNSESKFLYPIVVVALSTGARKGEILNLRWKDVDLKRSVIRLEETKNNERRAIPLTGHARSVVSELSRIRQLNSDLVFPGNKDVSRPVNIDKHWVVALQEAEITDFRFHDLRHSAASYLAMNSATLVEIAEILGHKTLQMVKRYAHLGEQHTAGVVEKMNSKIFGD